MKGPADAHNTFLIKGYEPWEICILPSPNSAVVGALDLEGQPAVAGQDDIRVEQVQVAGKRINTLVDLLKGRKMAILYDLVRTFLLVERIVVSRGFLGKGWESKSYYGEEQRQNRQQAFTADQGMHSRLQYCDLKRLTCSSEPMPRG